MGECYIVRRGSNTDSNEGGGVLCSFVDFAGLIPPVEEVFSGGEIVIFTEE